MQPSGILIYGAYGFTGKLIVKRAVSLGLKPTLAGRDERQTRELAEKHGLPWLAFDLSQQDRLHDALRDVSVMLHCAGPFFLTAATVAEACLATRTHYVDITGEIDVFALLHGLDARARQAGIVLLPGAGFDVVPSDCLAAMLKAAMPDAVSLELAFKGAGQPSRGTALSMVSRLYKRGSVRRGGELLVVPLAQQTRSIAFEEGGKPLNAVSISWGDVYTAFVSTGIPDITVFMAQPPKMTKWIRLADRLHWLMANPGVIAFLQRQVRKRITGPSEKVLENEHSLLWGCARNAAGQQVEMRLKAPEAYTLTAMTAVDIASRLAAGEVQPGFYTPSMAFGAEYISGVISVE